ncbi:unnamed protein product [Brassica oleracea var. botrytis]|uniref:Uncharacterized protein n=3 Tax=Brassica TaxID=3705 RepID=A0A0D3A8K3_BRAOL|nr:unnamed protein product [Brassica napus]CDY20336.1 BnaC01g24040D [Brassica napus]VDD50987.1 unnamed protein product [Brassica oleracea]
MHNFQHLFFWIMGEPKFTVVFGYSLPLSEIQILLIFIFIITSHMFFRFIGISQIASHFMVSTHLMERERHEKLSEKLLLDPALDGSAAGPLPIVIGILTFVVPLFGGLCFRNLYTDNVDPHYMPPKKVLAKRTVMISSQSSILLPMVTFILLELKIVNSELGRLAYYRQRRKQKKPLEVMDKEEEGSVEKLNLEEVKDLD